MNKCNKTAHLEISARAGGFVRKLRLLHKSSLSHQVALTLISLRVRHELFPPPSTSTLLVLLLSQSHIVHNGIISTKAHVNLDY